MKIFFILVILFCGVNVGVTDSTIDEVLRHAFLLNDVPAGIRIDLISKPDFNFSLKKKDFLKNDFDFKLTK